MPEENFGPKIGAPGNMGTPGRGGHCFSPSLLPAIPPDNPGCPSFLKQSIWTEGWSSLPLVVSCADGIFLQGGEEPGLSPFEYFREESDSSQTPSSFIPALCTNVLPSFFFWYCAKRHILFPFFFCFGLFLNRPKNHLFSAYLPTILITALPRHRMVRNLMNQLPHFPMTSQNA